MSAKILINASDPEEIRVATVKDGRLEEFRIEAPRGRSLRANIYKGLIARIEPACRRSLSTTDPSATDSFRSMTSTTTTTMKTTPAMFPCTAW